MFMHLTLGSPFIVSALQRVQGLKNSSWMLMIWSMVFPVEEGRKNTLRLCNAFKKVRVLVD